MELLKIMQCLVVRISALLILSLGCLLGCQSVEQQPLMPVYGAQVNLSKYYQQPVSVTLSGGSVNFHDINGYSAYQAIHFTIHNNEILRHSMTKAGNNFFDSNVVLTAYYHNGMLYLDYDPKNKTDKTVNAAQFQLSAAWFKGKVYHGVNTHGVPAIRNATLSVKVQ